MEHFDIVVVGSGMGGSLMSAVAKRLGYSVLLLEKGTHPRFVIGESTTPLTNLLIEHLAHAYDLPWLTPLSRWGTWQSTYPQLGCGLKRGFSFFHQRENEIFTRDDRHNEELLVAASPKDAISDTHWYRPDFDHFLVQKARSEGAEYRDRTSIEKVTFEGHGVQLQTRGPNGASSIYAGLLIDATGPNGFLSRALKIPEDKLEYMPQTEALYTHFRHAERLADMPEFQAKETPPYPIDDSAVHHIFPGGWVWVLRFNNGMTSAGVVATREVADELKFSDGAPAWRRLVHRFPTMERQFGDAEAAAPWVHHRRVAFRSSKLAGERWVMLPSAAGFIDPMLSTGFPLTLLGIARLGTLLENSEVFPNFDRYELETRADSLATEQLVAGLYSGFESAEKFKSVSFLYFASILYTETLCRLGKREVTGAFLLRDLPFWSDAQRCLRMAQGEASPEDLKRAVVETIERFDLGSLLDPAQKNWYSADSEILIANATKAGVTSEEMARMLNRLNA